MRLRLGFRGGPIPPSHPRAESDGGSGALQEILHIRDSRLYAPRDFDVSPYFRIIKPTLEQGFDPHALTWASIPDTGAG